MSRHVAGRSLARRLLGRNYDVMVRYVPAARLIRRADPDGAWSVLDVGSGATGIAPYLGDRKPMGVDRTFPEGVPIGTRFCQASVTALPFLDRTWDVVTCIDVLEHLPPEDRALAIKEVFRVARRMVVIACPCGAAARDADESMFRGYVGSGKEPPPWLREHLRQPPPQLDSLEAEIRSEGGRRGLREYDVFFNESLRLQRAHRFLARKSLVGYKLFSVLCSLALPILARPLTAHTGYRCFIRASLAAPPN